ncbi:hypothetical protein I4U23_015433 [Adineta vaga]|nr:hypothetical protein I4U23_015433 [Adineta vaga]
MVEEIALVPREISNRDDVENHQEGIEVINRIFNTKTSLNQFLVWIFSLICLLLITGPLTWHISYLVPMMKTRNIPSNMFSEERARDYLLNLTQYGSRVVNTYGNYAARDYLILQIQKIFSMSKRKLQLEIDRQNFTDIDSNPLQNIIIRISKSSVYSQDLWNILLSAHYDSVEFSPGSSDDGSGVVILLELLSNILNDLTIDFSTHNLIIVFTDAEEMGLQGARTFKRQHVWYRNIQRFINVDSVHCNQVANLIQIQSSQLALEYSHVPKPRTNVLLQHIAVWLGIRTDYDMYILYDSKISGYNFGFFLDGYTYHTSSDDLSTIKSGVLQELGDNLLVLIRNIFLDKINDFNDDSFIYFDILGRYLMVYKLSTTLIIQRILIFIFVIISISLIIMDHFYHRKRSCECRNLHCIYVQYKYPLSLRILSIIIYSISNMLSLANGFLCSILIAFVMSLTQPFSWFGSPLLAILLFSLPYFLGVSMIGYLSTRFHCFIRRKFRKQPIMTEHFDFEQNISMMIIFISLMIISIRWKTPLLYIVLVWTIFIFPIYLLVMIIEFLIEWKEIHWKMFHRKHYWYYLPLMVSLFPLAHTIEIAYRLIRILIPILARRFFYGWSFHENRLLCCIIVVPTMLFTLILLPILQRTKCFGRVFISLSIGFVIIWMLALIRQPFTKNHPNTLYPQHMSNTTYKIENLTNISMNASLVSQSSLIKVLILADVKLLPILEDFSAKSGHLLQNKHCFSRANCTFDDTFNRPLAIENIRIEPRKTSLDYTLIIQHVSSYNIYISSLSFLKFNIRNRATIPRTTTIIDLSLNSTLDLIEMNIVIRRCDLKDSPFLLLFTRFVSNILPMGDAVCQTIEDSTKLIIDFNTFSNLSK